MNTSASNEERHPVRWILAVVFSILAFLSAVGSAVGFWTHDVLFDTDAWVETVGPVGTDPVVTDAIADYTAVRLVEELAPTERLTALLPDVLAPLAEVAGGAIENAIHEETSAFFESDLYDNLWNGLNRSAHTAVVAIVRDQVPFLSTAEGTVSVDLVPVVEPIVERVIIRVRGIADAIPEIVLDRAEFDDGIRELIREYEQTGLPEELSEVIIYESDRLAAVQQSVALFDRLVVVLPILTLVFAVLAVIVAPVRRWMVPILLLGTAGAWALSILITDLIVAELVSRIVSENAADVAEEMLNVVTAGLDDLLGIMLLIAVTAGALALAALWYTGRRQEDAEVS